MTDGAAPDVVSGLGTPRLGPGQLLGLSNDSLTHSEAAGPSRRKPVPAAWLSCGPPRGCSTETDPSCLPPGTSRNAAAGPTAGRPCPDPRGAPAGCGRFGAPEPPPT